jgi:hypothetical protein
MNKIGHLYCEGDLTRAEIVEKTKALLSDRHVHGVYNIFPQIDIVAAEAAHAL